MKERLRLICSKADVQILDEIDEFYQCIHEALGSGSNYPGWIRDVYPTVDTARKALDEGSFFIGTIDGKAVASVILNHEQPEAYGEIEWSCDCDDQELLVVHTLAVHPAFQKEGVGAEIMKFTESYAREQGMKTIRLDCYGENLPAVHLYEKCGYTYKGTIDLHLSYPGLDWFHIYEMIL